MRVKTAQGKFIDMAALLAKNETAPALGNANMNARGDIIGKNGVIVKTHAEVAAEYHNRNPSAVKQVSISADDFDNLPTISPEDAAKMVVKKPRKIVDSNK